MELTFLQYSLIGCAGIIGAFIGVSAGGSGLIVLPTMIAIGLSAKDSVVNFEIGSLGLMLFGALAYHNEQKVDYPVAIKTTLTSMLGAFLGASVLVATPTDSLDYIVGVSLVSIALLLGLKPELGTAAVAKQTISRINYTLGLFLFIIIGAWSGYISAGAHMFANYILIVCFGKTFLECAGITKIQGIGTGIVVGAVFISAELVRWDVVSVLFVCMAIGAYLGAKYSISRGDNWVRMLFLSLVILSTLQVFFR